MADAPRKRKQASDGAPLAKRPRFPQRPQHHIQTHPTKSAYPDGEVNVKSFLKSHENEIKSLENAMRAAKKGLSRRAFQDVPRELRRRTASHNPQRVPKRLRVRARQEAKEDNTPISKGKSGSGIGKSKQKHLRKDGIEKSRQKWETRARRRKDKGSSDAMDIDEDATRPPKKPAKPRFPSLSTPATPPSRFRRRQRDKTWLPTHVWHSKRARMTEPKDPLWRFALPLQPAVKAYRLTHRAATQRGAVAWDMSYWSTVSLEGVEASIMGLLKGLHFSENEAEDPWQSRGRAKKWRNGTRTWEGWIHERATIPLKKIAQITVIWCVAGTEDKKRKAFIRVHPGAFLPLWNELVRVSKVQKPGVIVEDLRFEIGSIEIMGPAAAETLCSVLAPTTSTEPPTGAPESSWPTLASLTDVASLPAGALLAFNIRDPRFSDPPTTSSVQHNEQSLCSLMEHLAAWPIDSSQGSSSIFSRNARLTAQRCMPSQKSINRRKSACTLGQVPESRPTDPQIPVLMYTSKESKSWVILLPWKCVQPVWRGIMRYPVSTGGNPRFGGLKERRQVNFERSAPQFPFDHPATDAGSAWELRERQAREHEWTRRPKGKRIEWSTIDLGNDRKGEIGNPWACEWDRLLPDDSLGKNDKSTSSFSQLSTAQAVSIVEGRVPFTDFSGTSCLFTVKIVMLQRGTPTDCTRIYRLPQDDAELRTKWLALVPGKRASRRPMSQRNEYTSDRPEHIQRRDLARSLLEPAAPREAPHKAGEDGYPLVPDEKDLIGFVTTGNYNLAEGKPSAVANIALHRLLRGGAEDQGISKDDRICIVRPAGSTIGRLARWEVV